MTSRRWRPKGSAAHHLPRCGNEGDRGWRASALGDEGTSATRHEGAGVPGLPRELTMTYTHLAGFVTFAVFTALWAADASRRSCFRVRCGDDGGLCQGEAACGGRRPLQKLHASRREAPGQRRDSHAGHRHHLRPRGHGHDRHRWRRRRREGHGRERAARRLGSRAVRRKTGEGRCLHRAQRCAAPVHRRLSALSSITSSR